MASHTLTLGIVKPDAVAGGKAGKIVAHLEQAGFVLRAARLVRLTAAQAGAFYEVHRGRPFYDELVAFMTSGPCLPMALEREDAVAPPPDRHRRDRSGGGRAGHDPEALRRIQGHGTRSTPRTARRTRPGKSRFFFREGEVAGLWA